MLVAGLNGSIGFTVPSGAVPGVTYARFRLSSAGGLLPTGLAPDGEVEDYVVEIDDPSAVGMMSFDKQSGGVNFLSIFGVLILCSAAVLWIVRRKPVHAKDKSIN